ncbi:hypothetical protein P152DRAFT_476055 [Eremomyces bilateralis CBS 781.70]|uniref:Uncharacterized protein n=1 Tax=Eremomyces bilateralis CBS 781.70 TaxID=1392243 RepID=A0A6G1FW49_9PEZI|nr:uncharacterized protein P152DRAFT_476055 [Eremomyces bilateralis CBS 781.70]KAF1809922.1 hypothetical protein P152DRAFT_476055 [Eremomyces bilateralis CBS 781.70]
MFAADLSWTDPSHEKVGERRERKQRKREGSISDSQSSGDVSRSQSRSHGRRPSLRDAWGFSSSRSGRSSDKSSVKGSGDDQLRRYPSVSTTPTLATEVPRSIFNKPFIDLKDPALHPNTTYGAKLLPTLPSGGTIDPPRYDTIGFGRPIHSRQNSNSTSKADIVSTVETKIQPLKATNPDYHLIAPWGFQSNSEPEALCDSYDRVKDAVYALQARKTESFAHGYITKQTTVSILEEEEGEDGASEILNLAGETSRLAIQPQIHKPLPLRPERLRARKMGTYHAEIHATNPLPVDDEDGRTYLDDDSHRTSTTSSRPEFSIGSNPDAEQWPEVHPWTTEDTLHGTSESSVESCASPNPHETLPSATELEDEDTTPNNHSTSDLFDPASKRNSMIPMSPTAFQRFVQKIESAGAAMILERLREEGLDPADQLEKHLWALTALQLRSIGRFEHLHKAKGQGHSMAAMPRISRRRATILEIDGNLAETYQLSAIHPLSTIHHLHLTTSPLHRYTLSTGSPSRLSSASISPPLISPLPLPPQVTPLTTSTLLPLPFPPSTIHHIRSSALPALLPSSQLPSLLADIHRVLLPNGSLELRIVDPMPVRGTAGPKLRSWLEERLAMGLESNFRCQRPAQLVPGWVTQAGLRLITARDLEKESDQDSFYFEGSSPEASLNNFPSAVLGMVPSGRSTRRGKRERDETIERETGMICLLRIPAVVGPNLSAQMSMGLSIGAETGFGKRDSWRFSSNVASGGHPGARTELEDVREEPLPEDAELTDREDASPPLVPRTDAKRDERQLREEIEVVETEVAVLVLRELWRNSWGGFVEAPSELRLMRARSGGLGGEESSSEDGMDMQWWWEDEDIVVECRDWETVWEVGTVWAVKD